MTTGQRVREDASQASPSLVSLLGDTRASIVELLHGRAPDGASVAELADRLGISEVAVRRHLGVLAEDGLLEARRDPESGSRRGRPPARYHLTPTAARLFPQGYDRFAAEVLDFLADTHGRDGLRHFLRWRLEREVSGLSDAVTAEDLHERLEQLAGALSAAGFRASVDGDGDSFTLTQDHCAIYDVAKDHPEVCAYEAAGFSRVLGRDVTLSRRETLATGARACVCTVTPRDADRQPSNDLNAARGRTDRPGHPGEPTSETGRGDHQ